MSAAEHARFLNIEIDLPGEAVERYARQRYAAAEGHEAALAAAQANPADRGLLRQAVRAVIEQEYPGLRELLAKFAKPGRTDDDGGHDPRQETGGPGGDDFTEQDLRRAEEYMRRTGETDWEKVKRYARSRRGR